MGNERGNLLRIYCVLSESNIFFQGKIFILQCRPITMENRFSDWELIHEFDVAVMTEEDLWTTGNVQEAFPNAVTPLTMSFLIATADNMMKKLVKKGVRRTESTQIAEFFLCFNYHLFLDVFKVGCAMLKKFVFFKKKKKMFLVSFETHSNEIDHG